MGSKKKKKKAAIKRKKLKKLHHGETKAAATLSVSEKVKNEKDKKSEVREPEKITPEKEKNTPLEAVTKPVSNINRRKKQPLYNFETPAGSVLVFLTTIFLCFFIQYVIDTRLFPRDAIAQNTRVSSSALEAFMISNEYDIVETDLFSQGYYIAPGDTDSDAFTFGIQSNENTVILKELKLTKSGDMEDSMFIRGTLYEGDNPITSAKMYNGIFYFQKFSSILQPGTYKEYKLKLDLSDKSKPGSRFRFSIADPYDLAITVNDKKNVALDTYPIDGGYVTVVGWRR